jgi:mono/diheme cytochrome c family protein
MHIEVARMDARAEKPERNGFSQRTLALLRRCGWMLVACMVSHAPVARAGQTPQMPTTPTEIYTAWCAKCHAEDGTGRLPVPTVKNLPRDFTDCPMATAEPDADWELVTAKGGPPAGMSSEMPAFGDVMNPEQVRGVVAHLRAFCKETGWPLGNLNFPRPLFTEKAFPENELVVVPAVSHVKGEPNAIGLKAVYEQRLGRRGQFEVGLPLQSAVATSRSTGLGDISVATKYVFGTNRAQTSILTGGIEVVLPTGSESRALGGGTTVFEPFVASGVTFGLNFLQGNLKYEFPSREPWGDREFVYNAYIGRSLDVTPSSWTFGLEMNGVQKDVAMTPQVRKALTRTGALAAAAGVRIPVNNRSVQTIHYVGYVLWEYLDPVRPRP